MLMLLFVIFGENTILKIFKTSHVMSMMSFKDKPCCVSLKGSSMIQVGLPATEVFVLLTSYCE